MSRANKPASDYQPLGTDRVLKSQGDSESSSQGPEGPWAPDGRTFLTLLCSCYFTQAVNPAFEVTEELASMNHLCGATTAEITAKEAEKTPNSVQPEVESAKMC